jgi:hypothetical protein
MEKNMTTPYERTRAILETKQFLQDLAQVPKVLNVPKAVNQAALTLLRHYPTLLDIETAHKALPDVFGPVPPFSRMHAQTVITELGLDKLSSKNV